MFIWVGSRMFRTFCPHPTSSINIEHQMYPVLYVSQTFVPFALTRPYPHPDPDPGPCSYPCSFGPCLWQLIYIVYGSLLFIAIMSCFGRKHDWNRKQWSNLLPFFRNCSLHLRVTYMPHLSLRLSCRHSLLPAIVCTI